ncbi:sn-glycerol-3-phosphate ABC transporter substrate-binding protein UgpB [Lutimaribacter sp. EGI FJ00015]|uniref:Sn-glycerol-3-phosphate ABC transporter substrate-binding protein UgpB n=1 Tax=Lutimaribacter degradans TaxID=2945989 RepID=A0ACC5ZVR7_9RHOB|nr:sn-glycerol-3-phosphate ABC transporter substrate-binding protein UgpB [Lutimaribacter sp. EGI FJ00013]MCM2561639.1 sn-glycerol-3-phosphate ABC transporter substrate-binding protein UgpB [Lutimaribacter sp. EGI FJ00013]MCO0612650.1 sn-glycerol-3-phosphate ABC transporter substrate-binding protein UgpB [Lutimaribacter sp. EGI FJ00015]MCO0635308.1 sn-glycerol-3-phosphate ABC transporter substrate-binding protein UgpB [Lutimaribacter sp. EGI FJ00014]
MKTQLLATAAAISLSAVAAQGQERIEIQFWHAMGGQLGERTDAFATTFNSLQDTCTVNSVYQGNYTETMTAAIAAFRAGEQPNIVQVFEVGTATMMSAADNGAVYPVHQLMADQGVEFNESDYLPGVISYYSDTDGNLLSLPFNSSTPVMWVNKTVFEENGLEIPTTWDGVVEAARALKAAGVPSPFGMGWQSWTMIENFSAWHDLQIGTKSNGFGGTDTELTINNDHVVGHIQRLADMAEEGLFTYGGRRGDSRPQFVNGEAAMWINSSGYFGGFKADIEDFEFTQVPMPYDPAVRSEPQNSVIGGATLWVLQGHEDPEYACTAQFLDFLSGTEQQADWAQATGYVPITLAAAELMEERGFFAENPGTDVAISQLTLNEPTANSAGLRFGNFVQIRDVINEELEAVWSGNKTAKEAMDAAVERGNELLRRFEATAG